MLGHGVMTNFQYRDTLETTITHRYEPSQSAEVAINNCEFRLLQKKYCAANILNNHVCTTMFNEINSGKQTVPTRGQKIISTLKVPDENKCTLW